MYKTSLLSRHLLTQTFWFFTKANFRQISGRLWKTLSSLLWGLTEKETGGAGSCDSSSWMLVMLVSAWRPPRVRTLRTSRLLRPRSLGLPLVLLPRSILSFSFGLIFSLPYELVESGHITVSASSGCVLLCLLPLVVLRWICSFWFGAIFYFWFSLSQEWIGGLVAGCVRPLDELTRIDELISITSISTPRSHCIPIKLPIHQNVN